MLQCRHAQEFSFGPRALKDALISTDPALQELYTKAFSSAEKLFLSEAYNPHRTLFCSLFIRTAFDWLLSHPDAPEDFETFYYSLLRRKQRCYRKHIYLQPIDLSEGPVGISLLDSLQSCVESFFLGVHVKCLPSVPVSSIHCCYRHNQDSDRVQLHADGILTFLKNNKPMDALCVLGLTLADLYPCETWSFTFGKFLPGQGLTKTLDSPCLSEQTRMSNMTLQIFLGYSSSESSALAMLAGADGSYEVGVCSFARFSGDFPQMGCTTLNPSPWRQEVPDEVVEQARNQTLLFNLLEMLQCCKMTLFPSRNAPVLLPFLRHCFLLMGEAINIFPIPFLSLRFLQVKRCPVLLVRSQRQWDVPARTLPVEIGTSSLNFPRSHLLARMGGISFQEVKGAPLELHSLLGCPEDATKVTCHEICHLIGLGNCRWLQCIMQGALSLDEVLLRPLEPCPICLRKLQYVVGFKLIERYRKLYTWMQTISSNWLSQELSDLSMSEDILPPSTDSGVGCENDSEAVTSLSEPLTPDTCSQAVSTLQDLDLDDQSCSLADAPSQEQLGVALKPSDMIKEYTLWLKMCIAALEKDVSEEEILQVDKAVDAMARWEMFTGQLPNTRRDLPLPTDSPGLRKVLGDKFSSLRRKLSSRKLAKAESSPCRWKWEES